MSDSQILIGKVVAPFGIRGEVKLLVLTDFPDRFDKGVELKIKSPRCEIVRKRIVAVRSHSDGLIVKFEDINDRNAAEDLRNAEVIIDKDELAKLEEGRFYIFDIIGLKVIIEDGREQGVVTEVLQSAANDVYVTSTGLCIPALKDVVEKIDLENRVMIIRPVPGLLPERD